MSVSMGGGLPRDDSNGLASISSDLVRNPQDHRVGIVVFDVSKLTTKMDDGEVIPTVRIRAFEPIRPTHGDHREVHRLLRRAVERRTGQTELPLELERELGDLADDDGEP